MSIMKLNKLPLLGFVATLLLLASCSNDKKDDNTSTDQTEETAIFGIYQGNIVLSPIGELEGQASLSLPNQLIHLETHPQAQTLQLVMKNFEYEEQEYGHISVPAVYIKQDKGYELKAQNTVSIDQLGAFEVSLLGSIQEEKLEFDATFSSPQTNEQSPQPLYQVRFEGKKTDKIIQHYIFDFEEWNSSSILPGSQAAYALPKTEYPGLSWASSDREVSRLIDSYRMEDYTVKQNKQSAVSQTSSAQVRTLQAKGDNLLQIPTIYAGKLYLGQFKDKQMPPQQGILLGVPFEFKPTSLKGYYTYSPGETYYECPDPKQMRVVHEVEGKQDKGWIAAYLYEVSKYAATDEILTLEELETSERIVAKAEFLAEATTAEFEEFDISFRWKEGLEFDANKQYRLILYFTASQEGHRYSGAPGSTLHLDYLRLLVEQHQNND